ncbi:acetylornithine deacetylase [Maribacter sp. 4G9]|uniref:acetylornithine deacetylase n=1 Tax=Maribacter sp. 4G9 TaxID=1889777 RepID=UPI000C15F7CD|nr:acetylornithine deacetylase [Maribacter sp. 4G9]PIB38443.1 acetylornithine deacetylase (ArgE) [Maribacter sp. 4G9]
MREETNDKVKSTISILKDLISFSIIGGESNLSIARYITGILKENDIEYYEVRDTAENKMSIHCRIGPEVDGGIILSGHMDVVPIDAQPWTKPGFSLTQIGDKLYGRGTSDMKGFLACCLAIIPHFKRTVLKKPIYLAFSYDEEVGCLATSELLQSVKSKYKEKPRFAIIGEPTSMQTVNAEKGAAFFKTTVFSSAAHSSEVRKSVSAIEEATYLVQWLLAKMDGFIEQRNFDERFKPPHTTLHIGTIKGGSSVNIVADKCEFEWDVRNVPSDAVEDILGSFEAFCKKRIDQKQEEFPDFNINTSAQFSIVPGLDTSKNSEIVKLVNSFSGNTSINAVSFASEAGYFSQSGFETVVCGPGSMEQGHRADEYIEVGQLRSCIVFLEKIADWSKTDNKVKKNYEKV